MLGEINNGRRERGDAMASTREPDPPNWVDVGKFRIELAQLGLIAVGGAWAFMRFRKERTHAPQFEFDVGCRFFGPQHGRMITEYELTFRNNGLVRQKIRRIELRVFGIKAGSAPEFRSKTDPRLKGEEVLKIDNIIQEKTEYVFVEPKVTQKVTMHSMIDADEFSFLIVRARFFYETKFWSTDTADEDHYAMRIFPVIAASGGVPPAASA